MSTRAAIAEREPGAAPRGELVAMLDHVATTAGAGRAEIVEIGSDGAATITATASSTPAKPGERGPTVVRWRDQALIGTIPVRIVLDDQATLVLHQGLRGGDELRALAMPLVPPLRWLLALHRRLTAEAEQRRTVEDAVDLVAAGVIALDAQERIVFVNQAAERLLAGGHGLFRSGRSIAAAGLTDALKLRGAMAQVRAAQAVGADQPALLGIARTGGRRPLIVTVTVPFARGVEPNAGAIVLWLLDPDADVRRQVEAACLLDGLTSMELAFATQLVSGASVEDASRQLGIKSQTGRSYLRAVFLKTNQVSQAGLIRYILSGLSGISSAPLTVIR